MYTLFRFIQNKNNDFYQLMPRRRNINFRGIKIL